MVPYYPDHVKIMFEVLEFVNMDIEYLSNMFKSVTKIDTLETPSYSMRFMSNGIDTPLFLHNCASLLFSLFTSVAALAC